MKILLIADVGQDQAGFYHIGDEAMLWQTVQWYQTNLPKLKIGILSRSLSSQKSPVRILPHLPIPYAHPWINSPRFCVRLIGEYVAYKLFKRNFSNPTQASFVKQIESYDYFHFTGGGNLYSHHPPWLYYVFCILFIGWWSRTPVFLTSQTIGPFTVIDGLIAKFFLNLATVITIREYNSKYPIQIASVFKPKIRSCLDAAYTLPIRKKTFLKTKQGNCLRIGLSVHEWQNYGLLLQRQLIDSLTELAKKHHLEIVLLPHIISRDSHAWDFGFLEQIAKNLPTSISVVRFSYSQLMNQKTKPEILVKSLTAQLDMLITTRYHGLVFGLSSCVPCVTFALDTYYVQKNTKVLEMVYEANWHRFVIALNERTAPHLTQAILKLWQNLDQEKTLLAHQNKKLIHNRNFYGLSDLTKEFLPPSPTLSKATFP